MQVSDANYVSVEPAHARAGLNRRQHSRQAAGWRARCATGTNFVWEAWVADCSEGGFGLVNMPPLEVGEEISLELDDIGVFRCRVAWRGPNKCGVTLIPPAEVCNDQMIEDLAAHLRLFG